MTDDDQAILLRCWLAMAAIALSCMDASATVTITPLVEGPSVLRVTIEAEDLASLLAGECSFRGTIGKIRIEAAR